MVGGKALDADVGVEVVGGVRGVGEGGGGALDWEGGFEVVHGVVGAGEGGAAVGAEVEGGEEDGCQSVG